MVTSCWIWDGSKTQWGYGMVRYAGRVRSVHRTVYEELVGPIPEGLQLDHLCRTPACYNPDHLEPVTPKENRRRAMRDACKHGHAFTEANTYVARDGGRACRECHKEYQRARRARNLRKGD